MLTPQLRSQFITKTLTSNTGDQYRVVFLVGLVGGKVNARVVSSTLVSQKNESILFLPIISKKVAAIYTYKPSFNNILSPFNNFFFYNSQPTRAPSA